MPDGLLVVDKPAGPTSHDVVAQIRRAWRTRRVGHAGTLDPFATGVLLVLVGRVTRLARYLADLPKTYDGVLRLGRATTTDDLTGDPLPGGDEGGGEGPPVSDQAVLLEMRALTGRYPQQPPVFSAKKVGGRVAHRLARRGQPVDLAPQVVDVHRFDHVGRDGPDVRFEVEVGSGVYVRALARDLGARLGCGAHLRVLRRTAVGRFTLDRAVPLATAATGDTPLLPPREAVAHLPAIELDETARAAVRRGQPVAAAAPASGSVALLAGPDLVAVAEAADGFLHPRVVLEP